MIRFLSRGLALTLFAALLAAPAALAQATPPADQQVPQQQQAVPIDFTETELDAFAEVYVEIEDIRAGYQAEYGAVEDPTEAQAIEQRFQNDVMEVISASDIEPERYDQVIMATQMDQDFTESLIERIEAVRMERMGG
jgi:hypothetical protein